MPREKPSVSARHPLPITAGRSRLTGGFWKTVLETVRSTTIPFVLTQCEREGRLENFLIAGGKKKGPVRGAMPFDDSDIYKWIEGASWSLLSHADPQLVSRLDNIIEMIRVGQEPDGYLTTWFTIDPYHPPAAWVEVTGKRWTGEAGSHELYNSGHLFEAAAAHFKATGKRTLLDIAVKNADLLVASFGPGELTIPPGHEIVEQGLLALRSVTGKQEYANLARLFLDWRGDSATHRLYGEYAQDHRPVVRQKTVVGHAVRAMYLYSAMTDYVLITGNPAYKKAVKRLWKDVTHTQLYLTGGIGAHHEQEALGDAFDLPNLTAYCETCAAIGSVCWNQRLFHLTGQGRYVDLVEFTLYNGLLSGLSLDGKDFFYVNPLAADSVYPFNQGRQGRLPWFDCPCCPTNLVRFLPSLPGLVYAVRGDIVFVNLFTASRAEIPVGHEVIIIEQRTAYPWQGTVQVHLTCPRPVRFSLRLRLPGWTGKRPLPGRLYRYIDRSPGRYAVSVNGQTVIPRHVNGYIDITREWRADDTVVLHLPLPVRRVVAHPRVKADLGLAALTRGPLVYCVEGVDHGGRLDDLTLSRDTEWNTIPCDSLPQGIVCIAGETKTAKGRRRSLFAIPYFSWANRGPGPMKVWLPRID